MRTLKKVYQDWRDRLAAEANQQLTAQAARQAPSQQADVTVAFSKSVSVFYASIRANVRSAEMAGDATAVAFWAGREAVFSETLQAANLAALRARRAVGGDRIAPAAGQEPRQMEVGQ